MNKIGVRPATQIDILGVNLLTQFVYSFSNYGIYLFLIVPIYIVWKFGGMVIGFCCPGFGMGGAASTPEDDT